MTLADRVVISTVERSNRSGRPRNSTGIQLIGLSLPSSVLSL